MNKLNQFSVVVIVLLCFLFLTSCNSKVETSSPEEKTTPEQVVQSTPAPAPSSTTENKPENKPESKSVEQKKLSYEEWLKKTITEAIGDKTNYDKSRIESILFLDKEKTDMEITLWADDNLTPSFIRDEIIINSATIFHKIFSDPRAKRVLLYWLFPAKDVYGNDTEMALLQVEMTRKTANKINWSGFSPFDLEKVADRFNLHPSLQ